MAAFVPFEADVVASATGFTQVVLSTGAVSFTSSLNATVFYVANMGVGAASVRIDKAATTVAGAGTDTVLPINTVRLFANPNPTGSGVVSVCGVTVAATGVYVTPGQGGI